MKTITGDFDSPLTAKIQSGNKLKADNDITRKNVYKACEVLEVKVAGYSAWRLLEEFILLLCNDSSKVIY